MSKIQKQNILVVEDDPIQQDILKHVLAKLDFNVLTASDGKHCLEILKTEIPGMIMLDFHMPDMSGFQILKELKSHNKLSKIPVLMMSIDSSDESAILCISSGANGYIRKPINMHELILKMNNLLDLNIDRNQADGLIEDIMNPDTRVTIGQTPYILNYILGNEELQKTKASCTFASILSIRIHGLATLVSELESDKIQILLDEVIANISNIVYRNKGSINLFFNDLIICTFGIPMVYDNDTINALLCAEQLKKYEASFLKFAGKLTNLRIEMSTAITSGKIYYGSINATQKLNDPIMGTALFRAIQLENLPTSEHQHVIVDKNTCDVLEIYTDLEAINLEEPLKNYFQNGELYRVKSINFEKINQIPNLNKLYTPKDSVSDEGYEKL